MCQVIVTLFSIFVQLFCIESDVGRIMLYNLLPYQRISAAQRPVILSYFYFAILAFCCILLCTPVILSHHCIAGLSGSLPSRILCAIKSE